jgi:hypothetical protein
MENESRERNMALSKLGGMENSIVDEYVYEFKTVAAYLKYWF